jgi:hypothetical protein
MGTNSCSNTRFYLIRHHPFLSFYIHFTITSGKKVKLSLQQAMEAVRVVTSRLPHFFDNQLTDGGEVVNLMYRMPFTPPDDF